MPALSMLERLDNVLFLKLIFWSIVASIGIVISIWGGLTLAASLFGIFTIKYNTMIGLLFVKVVGVVISSILGLILASVLLAAVS
jgi:hypothetical protein